MKSKLEKVAENKFVTHIRQKTGCICVKLTLVGMRGFPDRMILCPGALVYFIEFKRVGHEPRKLQHHIHGLLRNLGFRVLVTASEKEAIKFHEIFTKRVSGKGD